VEGGGTRGGLEYVANISQEGLGEGGAERQRETESSLSSSVFILGTHSDRMTLRKGGRGERREGWEREGRRREGGGSVCESVCGDGVLRGGEECDDANVVSGDGCSYNCSRELAEGGVCVYQNSVHVCVYVDVRMYVCMYTCMRVYLYTYGWC